MNHKFFKKRIYTVFISLFWFAICFFVFNKYAYEIDQFNGMSRRFLISGKFSLRYFDDNGLPVTVAEGAVGQKVISPFYVVHYGLMHSETSRLPSFAGVEHWRIDNSIKYWNVPPLNLSKEQFRKNADWVVDNAIEERGQLHLIYKFDWKYRNYPNGGLVSPWWSGLTDGYALILMLRAYDIFGDRKYIDTANALYKSTVAPFSEGGSLINLNGHPWIEEYVDLRADAKNMSRVLNGMIYAYKGVKAYEAIFPVSNPISHHLENAIRENITVFDLGNWSLYDAIGNAANIKYHRIHVALLDAAEFESPLINELKVRWKFGAENPGFFWIVNSNFSYSQIHFIISFIFAAFFPWLAWLFFLVFRGYWGGRGK